MWYNPAEKDVGLSMSDEALPPSVMRDYLTFLGRFLRRPLRTGAIAPSSHWLARTMVSDMGLAEARAVVELGPGTGSFTVAIRKAIGTQTFLMVIEVDPHFARQLRKRFPDLAIVNDSAERLRDSLERYGHEQADSILCGIPWADFSDDLQRRLMQSVWDSLRPGGKFATFAYIHAAWFPAARRFRRLLDSQFSHVRTTPIVWRNLPPAFVYRCEK
jgi:phosphatidylethanolamine/phosphatidyl-N-methylethanolamine N-methyltransferase